jgi:HAMP domain-containing protein
MRLPMNRGSRSYWTIMAALTGIFAVMMVMLNLLLHRLVLRPVRRIAEMAEAVSLGDMTVPEFAPAGRDEIAILAESFNRMRRSFIRAVRMLDG